MKELPKTIGSKRNRSLLHFYLRFLYRSLSYTGFFSTKIGMYSYGFFYNLFKDFTEGKKWNYVCNLIQTNSIVIDAGSNIGAFTKYVIKKQNNLDIKIFAIEPEPQNIKSFELFYSKEIREDRINLVKKAVTEEAGNYNLYIDLCNPGGHLIASTGIPVKGITIDDLMKNEKKHVSLIKIDVEGYEAEAIKGAVKTINDNHPNIFIEYNPFFLQESGTDPIQFLNQMIERGYKMFTFSKNSNITESSVNEIFEKTTKDGWTDILMTYHPSLNM